jgi:hypothetical protein
MGFAMSSLQMKARSRVRVTVVLGRGRYAAEAVRAHRGSIEGDARGALRDWVRDRDDRYGEQFASDLGRSLCATLWFDGDAGCAGALAELDAALEARLLQRLRTRISEPPRDAAMAAAAE